ncbi:MAG: O-antigen ligase family protein [Gaiellaceae bacterium]
MFAVLLVLSLLLIRLPSVVGPGTGGLALIPAAVLLGAGQLFLQRPRRLTISTGLAAVYIAMLAVIAVAFFRAGQDGGIYTQRGAITEGIAFLLLGSFVFNAILAEPDEEARRRRVIALCFAPVAYVAVNELLYFGGVRAPINPAAIQNTGQGELLSLLGLSGQRVLFPYGEGLNGFGVMAGMSLVVSVVALRTMTGRVQLAGAAGVVASVYGLLAADSRGPFLFALAVCMALLAAPRVLRSGATGLPMVAPFAPAIIPAVLGLFAGTSVSSTFARGNQDFASATGRTDVWSAVLDFLDHFQLQQLVGWGFGGQLSSEVSYTYSYVVSTNDRPEFATAHNFILQSILDVGYLGTALFLTVFALGLYYAGKQLVNTTGSGANLVLGVLIYLLLAGTLESTPGSGTPAALGALLLVSAGAFSFQVDTRQAESAALVPRHRQVFRPRRPLST